MHENCQSPSYHPTPLGNRNDDFLKEILPLVRLSSAQNRLSFPLTRRPERLACCLLIQVYTRLVGKYQDGLRFKSIPVLKQPKHTHMHASETKASFLMIRTQILFYKHAEKSQSRC